MGNKLEIIEEPYKTYIKLYGELNDFLIKSMIGERMCRGCPHPDEKLEKCSYYNFEEIEEKCDFIKIRKPMKNFKDKLEKILTSKYKNHDISEIICAQPYLLEKDNS